MLIECWNGGIQEEIRDGGVRLGQSRRTPRLLLPLLLDGGIEEDVGDGHRFCSLTKAEADSRRSRAARRVGGDAGASCGWRRRGRGGGRKWMCTGLGGVQSTGARRCRHSTSICLPNQALRPTSLSTMKKMKEASRILQFYFLWRMWLGSHGKPIQVHGGLVELCSMM